MKSLQNSKYQGVYIDRVTSNTYRKSLKNSKYQGVYIAQGYLKHMRAVVDELTGHTVVHVPVLGTRKVLEKKKCRQQKFFDNKKRYLGKNLKVKVPQTE